MSADPVVVAVGVVDARGVRGSSGVHAEWRALGVPPLGTGRTFRALTGRRDPTWRRLDLATQALVLAAEAAGLARALPHAARDETALIVETERGCLDADLRFAACQPGGIGAASTFPGTLPSAGLGELALRFGLRGPTVCVSLAAGESGIALAEAVRLLEDGDASFVVTGSFEALRTEGIRGATPAASAVLVLLAASGTSVPAAAPLVDWSAILAARDPFAMLAATIRA